MAGPFEMALRQFAARAGENADVAVRRVVLEIGSRLIYRSPVDTGRFRANWFYSFNALNHASTEATGATAVNDIDQVPGRAAMGVHYIQNNLPYAMALERGHSPQAPGGLVGITVAEFDGIVDRAAAEVRR